MQDRNKIKKEILETFLRNFFVDVDLYLTKNPPSVDAAILPQHTTQYYVVSTKGNYITAMVNLNGNETKIKKYHATIGNRYMFKNINKVICSITSGKILKLNKEILEEKLGYEIKEIII